MATKVLGSKLNVTDFQYLAGLAKNASERRVLKSLFTYQVEMISRLGLEGIDNCKQLHQYWIGWIVSGCPEDRVVNHSYHHGFRARLRYAMKMYLHLLANDTERHAKQFRNAVTTVLRSYQVCGPTAEQMAHKWKEQIKSELQRPLAQVIELALIRGLLGIPMHFDETGTDAHNVYVCGVQIRSYFNMIERIPISERKGFYRILSNLLVELSINDYSQLLKRSPHRTPDGAIVSIFGEAIDYHALHDVMCLPASLSTDTLVDPSLPGTLSIDEYDWRLFESHQDESLLDIVHRLNEALVDTYKYSKRKRKSRDTSLVYAPKEPVGEVPSSIEVNAGRTVLLADKAGKTRPISISTYTVNNTLNPIHRQLMRLITSIRQDSTDQEKGIAHILDMTKNADAYICSADLSAATDRLPVVLQTYILYRVIRLSDQNNAIEIANYWYTLMTCTPFKDPISNTDVFYYGTGQPMGTYTSWPMLSLTNHIMIRTAYWASKDKSLDYLVCGDDTVIGSKLPFEKYETWMNSLGVKINRSKSHICETSDPIKVAEFCKRLAVNGELVSSDSPKLLITAARDKAYAPAAISCLHDIIGPLSKRKVAALLQRRLAEDDRIGLPFRYGGWNIVDNMSLPAHLLRGNFIFLYIYKMMRSAVSALQQVYSADNRTDTVPQYQIDRLAQHSTDNLYRDHDYDYRLLGRKVYTPLEDIISNLTDYENFLIGRSEEITMQYIYCTVKKVIDCLQSLPVPVRIIFRNDEPGKAFTQSELAIRFQRMYARARRNLESRRIHVFLGTPYGSIEDVNIMIDWNDTSVYADSTEFVYALDNILFRGKS